MAAKNLLRLPQAETIQPSASPGIKFVVEGAPNKDMTVEELKKAYSLSSTLIHERHPERIDREKIEREMAELTGYAERLQSWLWTHMMFFHGEAILVQMSMFDTPSFITQMTKEVLP